MIELLIKILVIVFSPFAAYGFAIAVFRAVEKSTAPMRTLIIFGFGFALFLIIWRVFKRQLQVVCAFEHEVTHLLFGLLLLKWPHSFVVTRHSGGSVSLSGVNICNFLITLAPYFFPTVSFLLIPVFYFAPANMMPIVVAFLGASVAFHLVSTIVELHWGQTDLHTAGIPFSILFLPVAILVFYGSLAAFVFGGTEGFLEFWNTGASESIGFLKLLVLKLLA